MDQLVLSIYKVQMTRTNPLGREQETIFFHNFRTTCTPNAPIFTNSIRWFAFRLESVLSVIKNVLGKTFNPTEIFRMAEECSWTARGKCSFYDCQTNSWPIANTLHDDETNTNTLVPLTEDELLIPHLKDFKALFIKQSKFKEIVESVDNAVQMDIMYESITIQSADKEFGEYNFYECVVENTWFGYRCLGESTFDKYCGYHNAIEVKGSEIELIKDICVENRAAGFGEIPALYSSPSLLEFYGYTFPDVDCLPPGLLKLPFVGRDGENDELMDWESPPWAALYNYVNLKDILPSTPVDDEQTVSLGGPSPNRRDPGSTPLGESTLSRANSLNGPSPERPLKRRRRILDSDDEVRDSHTLTHN